jgi:hypothetical protein
MRNTYPVDPRDAGTAAGMTAQKACSTAGMKVMRIVTEREEIGGQ